jgi:hypothetical protein
MADDTKTVRELVFFYPDHRADGRHGAYGEGFEVEPEVGDTVERHEDGTYEIAKASGERVLVAEKWLWMTDTTREIKKFVAKPTIIRSSD